MGNGAKDKPVSILTRSIPAAVSKAKDACNVHVDATLAAKYVRSENEIGRGGELDFFAVW